MTDHYRYFETKQREPIKSNDGGGVDPSRSGRNGLSWWNNWGSDEEIHVCTPTPSVKGPGTAPFRRVSLAAPAHVTDPTAAGPIFFSFFFVFLVLFFFKRTLRKKTTTTTSTTTTTTRFEMNARRKKNHIFSSNSWKISRFVRIPHPLKKKKEKRSVLFILLLLLLQRALRLATVMARR